MQAAVSYVMRYLPWSHRRALSRLVRGRARTLFREWMFGQGSSALIREGPLAGCRLHAPLHERLAYGFGSYEPVVMAEIQRIIRPESCFFDVGAHIGYFSLLAAKAGARVFAFEPNPANVEVLQRNVDDNRLAKVTVVPKAVSDRDGTLRFATFPRSSVGKVASENLPSDARIDEIACCSLDGFVFGEGNPSPASIKIDVEGAEGSVLRGARVLLERHRPVLLVEMHGRGPQEAVLEATAPFGYEWRRLDREELALASDEVGRFVATA